MKLGMRMKIINFSLEIENSIRTMKKCKIKRKFKHKREPSMPINFSKENRTISPSKNFLLNNL